MKHVGNKNITYTQRLQIETLLNSKISISNISKQLSLHRSTIYKEIKKGLYNHLSKQSNFWYKTKYTHKLRYSAQIAQDRYNLTCTAKGRPLKIANDYKFVHYFENRVHNDKISARAVWGEIKYKNMNFKTKISKTTLYRYIRLGIFDNIVLEKRPKKYEYVKAKRAPKGTSIEKRPLEIEERKTFGHWEMDCVCGSTKTVLLVLTERLTRTEIVFKMQNQKADNVIKCLNILERKYGKMFKKVFKSITVDNGSEFSNYKAMEKSIFGRNSKRTTVYYCHPYSSWERGTNERMNREIRRLVPKGSNLSKLTDSSVKQIENWLNNYPRSVLNFASSKELFEKQLKLLN